MIYESVRKMTRRETEGYDLGYSIAKAELETKIETALKARARDFMQAGDIKCAAVINIARTIISGIMGGHDNG